MTARQPDGNTNIQPVNATSQRDRIFKITLLLLFKRPWIHLVILNRRGRGEPQGAKGNWFMAAHSYCASSVLSMLFHFNVSFKGEKLFIRD